MTKEELIQKLRDVANTSGDIEDAHLDADALLLEYIDDKEIEEAYDAIEKWYA